MARLDKQSVLDQFFSAICLKSYKNNNLIFCLHARISMNEELAAPMAEWVRLLNFSALNHLIVSPM